MFPTVTSLILQALLHFTTFVQAWRVRFVTLSAASERREKVEPVLGKTVALAFFCEAVISQQEDSPRRKLQVP